MAEKSPRQNKLKLMRYTLEQTKLIDWNLPCWRWKDQIVYMFQKYFNFFSKQCVLLPLYWKHWNIHVEHVKTALLLRWWYVFIEKCLVRKNIVYRFGRVNSKSFVDKDFFRNKWKYELTMHFRHEMIGKHFTETSNKVELCINSVRINRVRINHVWINHAQINHAWPAYP